MNRLFLNTILLGGTTETKIAACRAAGFDEIELWRQDLEAYGADAAALKDHLATQQIGLTDYQVLLDFDGAPDSIRQAKRDEALHMLDTAAMLGATTLLTPASTHSECVEARIAEDMAWLADQAAARRLRIAYEAMAWSTINHFTPAAWQLVQSLDRANLGLVIDAFHIFVRHRSIADLDGIPADKIFLVQLSDLDHDVPMEQLVDTARHHRLLPGQGKFPIAALLDRIRQLNYTGPIGLEVFNDDMKAADPEHSARAAMAALRRVCGQATA